MLIVFIEKMKVFMKNCSFYMKIFVGWLQKIHKFAHANSMVHDGDIFTIEFQKSSPLDFHDRNLHMKAFVAIADLLCFEVSIVAGIAWKLCFCEICINACMLMCSSDVHT